MSLPEIGFPDCIDNTIRDLAVTCQRKAYYHSFRYLHRREESIHLHAGGAFAAGLERTRRAFFEERLPQETAILFGVQALVAHWGDFEPGFPTNKTCENMVQALHYYFDVWPMEYDTATPYQLTATGKHAIEWKFKVPIPGLVHPDTGGPMYYVGRSDVIAACGGLILIQDEKTSTTLGERWQKNWDLDSQFTGYAWAAREQGIGADGALIRGISVLTPKFDLHEDPDGPITKLVRKKEKRYRSNYVRETSFGHAQSIVYRPAWVVNRWLEQLRRDIQRLIAAYREGYWDYAISKSICAQYGGCPYTDLCLSEDPELWVEPNYIIRKWDPLA